MGLVYLRIAFFILPRHNKLLWRLVAQKRSPKLRRLRRNSQTGTFRRVLTLLLQNIGGSKLYHESPRLICVLYTAPTYGPCRTLKPIRSKVIDEFDHNVHFVETDIEENLEIAEVAGIMGTPCVQFFKNKENLRLFFFYTPGAGPTVKSGSKGKRHHLILTKTLEWTLNWCILQSMFDRQTLKLTEVTTSDKLESIGMVQATELGFTLMFMKVSN
ncbi:uncharacterized protein LOC107431662 isoform X2 [Ziziphus jujuba]|nr:uncharacterized protein LOC107431662 isoform X2 [Ziziphus jujuba]